MNAPTRGQIAIPIGEGLSLIFRRMGALLAAVVDASDAVAATRKRSEKTAILATLLSQLPPAEAGICVGWRSGEPRQGRIGVGWAALRDLDVSSSGQATLTVAEVDDAIT